MNRYNYKFHYTYLITNLKPTSEKIYYIGVHSGNTDPMFDDYFSSSFYLKEDIKQYGKENFEKIIIKTFASRDDADEHELLLHKQHNVVHSKSFYNRKNGITGFHSTPESVIKANRKDRITKNDPKWKETTGKNAGIKQSITKRSVDYKEGNGKIMRAKLSEIRLNPIWKATTGKNAIKKQMATKNSQEWIDEHTITCPYCQKSMIYCGFYNKYHNKNCKQYKGE